MKRLCLTLFLLVILTTSAFANDRLALKASIGYARWIPVIEVSDNNNKGGGCLLGKFLYNLNPTTSIGIESGIFFWGRAKGEIEDRGSSEGTKTSIPFFIITHLKVAGDEKGLSCYYLDLGIGVHNENGIGWGGGLFMGFLVSPGVELYLPPVLKLDIFVEIQYLLEPAFGGGAENVILMVPSGGIRF